MPKSSEHPMVICVVCEQKKRHRALGKCWDCYHRDYSRLYMRDWRKKHAKKSKKRTVDSESA